MLCWMQILNTVPDTRYMFKALRVMMIPVGVEESWWASQRGWH